MNKFAAFLVLFLSVVVGYAFQIQPKIIGGDEATKFQFPFFAHLKIYEDNNFISKRVGSCGSVLISDQWIISAAHCLEKAHKVVVLFGTFRLSFLGEKYHMLIMWIV